MPAIARPRAAPPPCLLQDLWRDFMADFVLQVARRPVVVAGNSIGGFISASMAADYPGLVDGLILINSAGQIVEGYRPPEAPPASSAPPAFVVDGVSRVRRWCGCLHRSIALCLCLYLSLLLLQ